jgi:hypothetical protein
MDSKRTIVPVRLVGPGVVEMCGRGGRVEVSWSRVRYFWWAARLGESGRCAADSWHRRAVQIGQQKLRILDNRQLLVV